MTSPITAYYTAYYTTKNTYNAIVIPATNQFFGNPSESMLEDFRSSCPSFAHWTGSLIDEVINTEEYSEQEIAELFGEIIEKRSEGEKPFTDIDYEAMDSIGRPYWRKALTVGELPLDIRAQALAELSPKIAKRVAQEPTSKINFGRPLFYAFGMQLPEAEKHREAALLLKIGADLPLVI